MEASDEVSQSQASSKHAEILTKVSGLSDLVEAVESEYWRWCTDADATPLDMVAKQQVYDWLVGTGEKAVVLVQLRELGARRCLGTSDPSTGVVADGLPCRRFLQYGLYKSKVLRCPACNKESKRLVALSATDTVQRSLAEVTRLEEVTLPPQGGDCPGAADSTEVPPELPSSVTFSEAPPSSIQTEARELAWALYAACPNTYFRAHVLPSDLEIAKENGTPVMVSWLDGDRRYRSVPTKDVTMMDHPLASEAKLANAALWCNDSQRLLPRNAGK